MRNVSYDDGLLKEGQMYTVGTNDSCRFKKIIFVGYKLMNGKPMMVFNTVDSEQITINPSFHTFTMEDNEDLIPKEEIYGETVISQR